MVAKTINELTQAQSNYIDRTDELVIQKSGEDTLKKIQSNDLFGGWRDLIASITSGKAAGVNQPTWAVFGAGGMYQYTFAVNDEVWLNFHIDHDMKQSATMYPHVHWSTDGTDTNTVKWEINYTVAARDGEPAFPTTLTTVTVEGTPNGTAYSHYVTEDTVGVATPEVDSLVLVHLKRITNGGTDNTDAVYGLTMDWHYPTEGFATKNRAPNFYT